jgi:PAS domain S-box-containing protein
MNQSSAFPSRVNELELENSRLREENERLSARIASSAALTGDAVLQHTVERGVDLSKLLDSMPAMIGYWDRNQSNRFSNKAYSKWFGLEPEQIVGKQIREVLGEAVYRLNLPYIEAVLRGEPQEFERAIPSPDGKRVRHSLAEYIPDIVAGEVRGFYVQVSDITSVKEAEAGIKHSEAKFRTLYDSTGDAVMLLNESGFIDCNVATLAMFGCPTREDFCARHPADLSPPAQPCGTDSMTLSNLRITSAMAKGSNRFDWVHQRADTGQSFPAEVLLNFLVLDGKPVLQAVVRDISERKNLEASIKQSEARYHALFENAKVPMLLIDPQDGRIVDANQAAEVFYGYDRDALRDMPISAINALPREEIMAEMALAKSGEQDCFYALHHQANGAVRQVEVRSGPLEIDGRGLLYSLVNDITERRAAELALVSETARLYALLETASDGIHILDENGNLIQFSHSFATMLGYADEEMSGFNVTDWDAQIPRDDLAQFVQVLIKSPAKFETRHRCKDGSIIDVEVNSKGIEIGGDIRLYASSRDITERKQKEEALRQAELLLRTSIETIGEAFVIFDQDDRLAFCNDEYRQIYYQSAPVIEPGRTFEEIVRYGLERGQYKEAIGREEAWLAERVAAHRQGNQNLIQHLDDGRWLKITERRTPSGHIVGFRVDVTEFYRAKEAAEAANIAKSRFLATMSHEIRTPMNGILGMAQLLQMPDLNADERQDYVKIILDSGQTLLTLLNDILDLSKVESGKVDLESTPFEPGQLIRKSQALFAEAAGRKGLQIECDSSEFNDQMYLGDAHRLRQMLANLVGNAIKFTAQGHVRIEAREIKRDGTAAILEFAVTDSGIGIPDDKQALLFKPFSQADSSTTRQFGGTGLGLSIVRSFAKLMGGEVGIESEVGRGSRFWFRIRADLALAGEVGREQQQPARQRKAGEAGKTPKQLAGHLLVVEDNPTNRKVIQALLEKLGLSYSLAEDGQKGVDAIAEGMPADLILMDVQMPVMDGYTAAATIRQWETEHGRPRRPIIALTADAFEEDRQRCLAAGMDDFLAKPIALDKLAATLGQWLPGRPLPTSTSATLSKGVSALPVFDQKALLNHLGGDAELALAVVDQAAQDIATNLDRLAQAVVAGDRTDIKRIIHTLKGLAGQMGATRLSHRVKLAEVQLQDGVTAASDIVASLRDEYQTLANAAQGWLH